MTKNYCLICGEFIEVGKRFEHCKSKHGLFPGVPVEDKMKKRYTIMGIFTTKEELISKIKTPAKRYLGSNVCF